MPHPRHHEAPESGSGYHLLLAFLLSLILLAPIFRLPVMGMPLSRLVGMAVVVAAVIAVRQTRWPFLLALVFGSTVVVLGFLAPPSASGMDIRTAAANAVFNLYLALLILGRVLRHQHVTTGTVCGALCTYLLVGVAWSYLYMIVLDIDPEAFRGVDALSSGLAEAEVQSLRLVYYSFVTLTTLGFGDVTPLSPAARSLTILEAILGQIFLVAVVSRLVGLQISHSMQHHEGPAGGPPAGTGPEDAKAPQPGPGGPT